jgi:lipopolysaccharide export system permease protein
MRLLDRYLLRELLVPLGYCLGGFLLFFITSDLIQNLGDFQRKNLSGPDILEYYAMTTPQFAVQVLPIALLLALLYSLTHHARHHELTAMRSAGLSLWRLCLPYFGVGLAAGVLVFVLNEFLVPEADDAAEQIRNRRAPSGAAPDKRLVQNLGFRNARDQRLWQIGTYNVETGEMTNPQVIWTQADGSRLWIKAERAVWTNGSWTFFGLRGAREASESNAPLVPVLHTNMLALPSFSETPEEIKSEIRISNSINAAVHAKRADIPIVEILNYLRLHPNPSRFERCWLHTRLHGRLAAPWTCLVVVLIAIPFGATSGRRNVFVGVAGSVSICFVFVVMQQFALAAGTGGLLPPLAAAWLPNTLFAVTGLVLTGRVR